MSTTAPSRPDPSAQGRLRAWILQGLPDRARQQPTPGDDLKQAPRGQRWWRVMCLTGVDYFSTLGFQPGTAALAAGLMSPVATVVLVLVTLAGALPVYRRVAQESPHGQGSFAMLERLLSSWPGKLFILVLLGFAATDFIITITMSAADASTHLIENPHFNGWLHGHQLPVTLIMVVLLGVVFLNGFQEAIGVAVVLVGVFLTLNLVLAFVGLWHVVSEPHVVTDWSQALTAEHSNPLAIVGISLLVFPKLALGLSGFETGVMVMPHIRNEHGDIQQSPAGRIRGTKKLLTTVALIMSGFLITSSFLTTLLIPQAEFEVGGEARGRALAYLAHEYLGSAFGTAYDLATILILWFAGASAMAGLLSLLPRYLPRYGMAPHWARAVRPMVLVLTLVAVLITWIFDADVQAQSSAYATGVLVLVTSAAVAVTIAARRARQRGRTLTFGVISAVFAYTTVVNVVERPDGVKIAACFVIGIVIVSLLSRCFRAFELRVTGVVLDPAADRFLCDMADRRIRLVAHDGEHRDATEYDAKLRHLRTDNDLADGHDVVFVEVTVRDPSDFESEVHVRGLHVHGHRVLTLESAAVANALAALLLHVRDATGEIPHIYFEWTEGSPLGHLLKFLLLGRGDIAPITREILRASEPDRTRRPRVHVG
ncbi:amino acid transporter [Streptomyces sp. ID05-04B]|nr:amino acid transporter [Streptomyces sp. ID05-04B]